MIDLPWRLVLIRRGDLVPTLRVLAALVAGCGGDGSGNGGGAGGSGGAEHSAWSETAVISDQGATVEAHGLRGALFDNGNLVIVWQQGKTRDSDDVFAAQYDVIGKSWSSPELLEAGPLDVMFELAFASNRVDHAIVGWVQFKHGDVGTPRLVYTNRFAAEQGQWLAGPEPVSALSGSLPEPAVAIGQDGAAVSVWHEGSTTTAAWFEPTSATWSVPQPVNQETGFNDPACVVFQSNANPLLVWPKEDVADPLSPFRILTAEFDRVSGQWGKTEVASLPGSSEVHDLEVIVAGDGTAVAVWYEGEIYPNGPLRLVSATRAPGSTWSGHATLTTESYMPTPVKLVSDATGNVMAMWSRNADAAGTQPQIVAARRPAGASGWEPEVVLESRRVLVFELAMAGDGTAVAGWHDGIGRFAMRRHDPKSGWGAPGAMGTPEGMFGQEARLLMNRSGRLAVVWAKLLDSTSRVMVSFYEP